MQLTYSFLLSGSDMMSSQTLWLLIRNTSPALERIAASMHGEIGQGGRGYVFIFAPSERVEGVSVSEALFTRVL